MERFRQRLFFVLCILIVFGMMFLDFIRVIPSIAMIGISLLGISYLVKKPLLPTKQNTIPYWALAGTFLILLPSWFYSNNHTYLLEKWQIALPYLVLPLAFLVIPEMSQKRTSQLYYLYFILVLLIAVSAFIYYLLNQNFVNHLYLESKVMPSFQSHHPTFSMMLAFATYVGYWFYQSEFYYKFKQERYLFLLGGIFLFIFTHVFSVRSGLMAMYILLFYELIRFIFQKKKVAIAIFTAIGMVTIGAITLIFSPTFNNKLANTSQDIKAYQNHESANNKSIASRMISYQNAIRIAKESSLFFGCGLGDVDDLNREIFKADYPEISKPIIPHNQFLFYLAAIGMSGVIIFTILLLTPLLVNNNFKNPLLLAHYLIILISFQFEAPLESQLGVAYSLIFILLPIHQSKKIDD